MINLQYTESFGAKRTKFSQVYTSQNAMLAASVDASIRVLSIFCRNLWLHYMMIAHRNENCCVAATILAMDKQILQASQ